MTEYPSIAMGTLDNTRSAIRTAGADERPQDLAHVPFGVVQREWDHTVGRIRECCEVQDCAALVKAGHYAHILIRKTDVLDIAQVEAILFENLLFSPWGRVEHQHSFILSGHWLWKWRRSTPWQADPVGSMIRLAPDAPRRMWTYRFNVIDA